MTEIKAPRCDCALYSSVPSIKLHFVIHAFGRACLSHSSDRARSAAIKRACTACALQLIQISQRNMVTAFEYHLWSNMILLANPCLCTLSMLIAKDVLLYIGSNVPECTFSIHSNLRRHAAIKEGDIWPRPAGNTPWKWCACCVSELWWVEELLSLKTHWRAYNASWQYLVSSPVMSTLRQTVVYFSFHWVQLCNCTNCICVTWLLPLCNTQCSQVYNGLLYDNEE